MRLTGAINGISYYRDKKRGYLFRRVTSVNADRIRTDPAFEPVRRNNTEFGESGRVVKLLRAAFRPFYTTLADIRMTSRLTKQAIAVIKSDTTHQPGIRTAAAGDMRHLQGLEFNAAAELKSILFAPYKTAINRAAGTGSVTIPPFLAGRMIKSPAATTHIRFISGAVTLDLEAGTHTVHRVESDAIPIGTGSPVQATLVSHFMPGSTAPVCITLGVEFLQAVNGQLYPLQTRLHQAMALVQVENRVQESTKKDTTSKQNAIRLPRKRQ